MTVDTSIGLDDPRSPTQSGIDDETRDEARAREARKQGDAVEQEAKGDLTREDIERGNDRNTAADQGNRSGATNKLKDDGIDLGR